MAPVRTLTAPTAMKPLPPGHSRNALYTAEFRSTRSQNACRRSSRCSAALPAIKAPLIAPIEVPITQSGAMPDSCNAWYTPAW